MPLQVIVVGAGIAGLCAATAIKQAGHHVEVFEKSRFLSEVGAAVTLSPNSSSVLAHLGFSFERARVCQLNTWETVDGINLETMGSVDQSRCEEKFGMPLMGVHRVDLHNELMRLAESRQGVPSPASCTVHCGAQVVRVSSEEGFIELQNGQRHYADLIVAADGLHSIARAHVVGGNGLKSTLTGFNAFRFLIPSSMIKGDHEFDEILAWKSDGLTVLADTRDKINERHMAWYECQDGAVQNLVGIHPSTATVKSEDNEVNKATMLEEFGHFHPSITKLIKIAPEIRSWPLMQNDPLHRWSKGKVLIIGDAAHAMLPFGGQGANQAIEDGGALGRLLQGLDDPAEIPHRITLFDMVRRKRASRIQILSTVRIGKEKQVEKQLEQYAEPGVSLPTNFEERTYHDFSFKVLQRSDEVLAAATPSTAQPPSLNGPHPENLLSFYPGKSPLVL
ncbi:hypothetical protein N7456_000004 [Penicillium angulare]|uniref:FAD-binding domain-containing protein n=1 Tax=Penicillium angulare TaxID=116970 RepID=A0A9W9GBR7_9EURO|nr:hypothetical protein N7456_000004 [Penicillium angulare]